ncbi:MAG: hypothetical protein AB7P07_03855 [Hyphomonadaceae bacterium]
MRRQFLIGLFGLGLSACVSSAASAPRRFSGVWTWSFETSSFAADDGAGPYWLEAEGAVWREITAPIDRSGRGPWGRTRLVIEGEVSAPGAYGHLGAYERRLRVTRVIEAALIAADGPPSGS